MLSDTVAMSHEMWQVRLRNQNFYFISLNSIEPHMSSGYSIEQHIQNEEKRWMKMKSLITKCCLSEIILMPRKTNQNTYLSELFIFFFYILSTVKENQMVQKSFCWKPTASQLISNFQLSGNLFSEPFWFCCQLP